DELKNLQYYTSSTITLRRELESGGKQITGNHRLVVVAGKTIEEVVIDAKTPGIAVAVSDHSITVSFEQGTSIEFVASGAGTTRSVETFASPPPDPFPGNNPERHDPEPEPQPRMLQGYFGPYALATTSSGQVVFQGKTFDAVGDSATAHLMIGGESFEETVKQHKTLPGMRLPTK
ncbi:MAG: DNA-directed RNA polymerase, partial [Byssovorax sp.]